MRLVDPASIIRKEPNVPKLTFPVVVTMAGSELRKAVKTVSTVADEIYFNVDNGQLRLSGVSDDKMDDAQYNISVVKVEATEPAKALYRADYIDNIAKTMAKADTMTVELKSDFPMRMSTATANGNCNILYFVAPRTPDA
jgi:DNA polymerase III sliding clamp (beta) subunit (PCNA family)